MRAVCGQAAGQGKPAGRHAGVGSPKKRRAVAGQLLDDVRQVHRFVAAVRGHRAQVARQQVGRVGLRQQAVGGDVAHDRAQVRAAALVAEPAGDAHVPALRDVIRHLFAGAGEAVHHHRAEPALEAAHHVHEVRVRVALVQEQRLAALDRQRQLDLERAALRMPRREVAVVVQPAFADGDDARITVQLAQFRLGFRGDFQRVVRMHAGGGEQAARVRARDFQRLARALAAGAGDHDLGDARGVRAGDDRVAVVRKALMAQVGADVDQVHGDIVPARARAFA
jgi:hypothetical protein